MIVTFVLHDSIHDNQLGQSGHMTQAGPVRLFFLALGPGLQRQPVSGRCVRLKGLVETRVAADSFDVGDGEKKPVYSWRRITDTQYKTEIRDGENDHVLKDMLLSGSTPRSPDIWIMRYHCMLEMKPTLPFQFSF